MKKIILSLILLQFLIACGTKKKATKEKEIALINPTTQVEVKEQYPQATLGSTDQKSDPYTINSIVIEGNFMIIDVSYGGGCETHEFSLFGNEASSKSIPPNRSIQLVHNSKGDFCKAVVTETLKFSISILAENYEKNNLIKLKLPNFDKTFEYSYD
jgi:hypothetical protein